METLIQKSDYKGRNIENYAGKNKKYPINHFLISDMLCRPLFLISEWRKMIPLYLKANYNHRTLRYRIDDQHIKTLKEKGGGERNESINPIY